MTRDDLIAALTLHACQCPQDAAEVQNLIRSIGPRSSVSCSIVSRTPPAAAVRIAKAVNPSWCDGDEWAASCRKLGAYAGDPYSVHGTAVRDLWLFWTDK